MKPGRIETYLHSDSTTQHKGGAMVKVRCASDFGARTTAFIDFTKRAAMAAYGMSEQHWETLAEAMPEIEELRKSVEGEIRETITVVEIAILKL